MLQAQFLTVAVYLHCSGAFKDVQSNLFNDEVRYLRGPNSHHEKQSQE
jgi:hypothetical protein